MRILLSGLVLLSLSACAPYYYDDHNGYDRYGRYDHHPTAYDPYAGAYDDQHYRRVSQVDDVRFNRLPGEPDVYDVVVRGRTPSAGWSDAQLYVARSEVNRRGELVLVLVAAPPGERGYLGERGYRDRGYGDRGYDGRPPYAGDYNDGAGPPPPPVYPNGTYAREGYTGNVVVAHFRIERGWDGHVVRVVSESNEVVADIRDPRYGWR